MMVCRRKHHIIFSCMFAFFFVVFFRLALPSDEAAGPQSHSPRQQFPLVWKHIHTAAGHGGGTLSSHLGTTLIW